MAGHRRQRYLAVPAALDLRASAAVGCRGARGLLHAAPALWRASAPAPAPATSARRFRGCKLKPGSLFVRWRGREHHGLRAHRPGQRHRGRRGPLHARGGRGRVRAAGRARDRVGPTRAPAAAVPQRAPAAGGAGVRRCAQLYRARPSHPDRRRRAGRRRRHPGSRRTVDHAAAVKLKVGFKSVHCVRTGWLRRAHRRRLATLGGLHDEESGRTRVVGAGASHPNR
mmetsp:Transcript_7497/g.25471  ORF Transcript_7497/g.25471 Transcript_7497/m.25471 type:complete len:226 (-) Transcript_7497:296-973(-)